jgi:hypothetical protein
MDFSIYERFADYRERNASCCTDEERKVGLAWKKVEKTVARIAENIETFNELLEESAQETAPLLPSALASFVSVRDLCDRLARVHRGRICAKIDCLTHRATVSLYVPFFSVSSVDLHVLAQKTEGVAISICRDAEELVLLFSVAFFRPTASPFDRAFEAFFDTVPESSPE